MSECKHIYCYVLVVVLHVLPSFSDIFTQRDYSMRFFGLFFFTSQHPNRPLMNIKKQLNIFRKFAEIFVHEDWISSDYLRQVRTFCKKSQNFLQKKSKLSADFTAERCGKARHSMNYSASRQAFLKSRESFDFSQIILWKDIPLCRILCGNSKLSADNTVERISICNIIRGKSKPSENYLSESFSIPHKVKI